MNFPRETHVIKGLPKILKKHLLVVKRFELSLIVY